MTPKCKAITIKSSSSIKQGGQMTAPIIILKTKIVVLVINPVI